MFSLNDKVLIKNNGIIGTVVNVSEDNGAPLYVVESDTPYSEGGYGGKWKLYDCRAEEIASAESMGTDGVLGIV